jgi:hypothetical protein
MPRTNKLLDLGRKMDKTAATTMFRIFTFTGRVHPERYDFGMAGLPRLTISEPAGIQSHYRFQLDHSQMTVQVQTNGVKSILDLNNAANDLARIALDALGYIWSAALDLEIVSCVDPDGQLHVFNTAFDGLGFREQGTGAEEREHATLNILIHRAISSEAIRQAIKDLRSAIREPSDTVFHCYRAVEAIRQEYFGTGRTDTAVARRASWDRLRKATGVQESDLRWLEELATRRRHGEPVSVSHETRERAIRLARGVLKQHCSAAQSVTTDQAAEKPATNC